MNLEQIASKNIFGDIRIPKIYVEEHTNNQEQQKLCKKNFDQTFDGVVSFYQNESFPRD